MGRGKSSWGSHIDTDLLGLYVAGKPLSEYADELNVTEPTVSHRMRVLGLESLPRGRPKGSRDRIARPPRSARI